MPRRSALPSSSETKITSAIDQAWIPATWAKAPATSTPTITPATCWRPRDTDCQTVTWTVSTAASGANTGIWLPRRSAATNQETPDAIAVFAAWRRVPSRLARSPTTSAENRPVRRGEGFFTAPIFPVRIQGE